MFRYYKLLYINEEKQIKDIDRIKEQLEMAEKYLITKACNLKVINILSNSIEENYKLISNILDCNIIDLDEMNLEIKKKENKVVINIFDDNMIDKSIEYKEKLDLNLKSNKRIKLFNQEVLYEYYFLGATKTVTGSNFYWKEQEKDTN